MKKKIIFAHLAILGANLIYAVNYGFAKDVMNGGYLPPFTFILFRAIGATFLFWITSMFYYEKILKFTKNYKSAANWLMGPVQGYLNENAKNWNDWSMPANKLGELISIVETNLVSFSAASQQILPLLIQNPKKIPKTIAEDLKLIQQSDADALMIPIQEALDKYPEKVEEYRAGKKGLIGLFMGEVMKITKGSADPGITNKLLRKILDS